MDEMDELEAYSESGVDLTLIRWMLSLTPAERLQALQDFHRALYKTLGEDAYYRLSLRSANAR